ncbi:MAG: GNAT family N-acetyltransferase [Anaerolineales bacterium]
MYIYLMNTIDEDIELAFNNLIPQLSQYSSPPNRVALEQILASQATFIFLAKEPDQAGQIVGTATLAAFETPTGKHGWIEDVVVDKAFRGQGIGRALTQACLEKARTLGLHDVNLTSRPNRVVANKLYQAMGFIKRQTNIYRLPLE